MKFSKRLLSLIMAALCMMSLLAAGCQPRIQSLDDVDMSIYPTGVVETDVLADLDLTGIKAMYETLKNVLAECEAKGLVCPYEEAAITNFGTQIERIEGELERGTPKYPKSKVYSLNKLYTETLESLVSYKYDLTEPLAVPNYDADTIKAVGDNLVALYDNGNTEPVYTVGFGHWINSQLDYLDDFDNMELRVLQVDIGMHNRVLVERGKGSHEGLDEDDQYDIDMDYLNNEVGPYLDKCSENNISVCILLCAQFLPDFIYEAYPEIEKLSSGNHQFSVYNEKALEITEKVMRATLEVIADKPALFSICIANEPTYDGKVSRDDRPHWIQYLKDTFGTVEALNAAINTSFQDFDSIDMPVDDENNELRYAYSCFNSKSFSGYMEWCRDLVAEYADIPVMSKVSAFMAWIYNYGCDQEELSKYTAVQGCDAFGFVTDDRTDKQMWYAYLTAIADAPIYNSEDHVIHEEPGEFDADLFADHIYFEMWLGALNGRGASSMWTWSMLGDDETYGYYGNASDKPLSLYAASRAALDLKRLHNEVAAFGDEDPTMWVLYSKSSMINDTSLDSYNTLCFAYKLAITLGRKVGLLTEATMSNLKEGDIVIVPDTACISDDAMQSLYAFAEGGGDITLFNECCTHNEYNQPRDTELLERFYALCNVMRYEASSAGIKLFNRRMFETYQLDTYLQSGGDNLRFVAYYPIEYNGKVLISMANYAVSGTTENITVTYQGRAITSYTDLITGKSYTAEDGIDLEPSQCALISFDAK